MPLEFQQEDSEVLAISTGSILSKVVFTSSSKEEGGVAGIKLVVDKEGDISHLYGVVREDSGYSYRAMVLIDRKGGFRCGIKDALRMVKEFNDEIADK